MPTAPKTLKVIGKQASDPKGAVVLLNELLPDLDGYLRRVYADIENLEAGNLTVEEQDGDPSVANVTKNKITNGDVTDDGDGVVSVDTSGGGGGGSMDDFNVAGDSGDPFDIADAETVTIEGGTGIATVASADTLTVGLDASVDDLTDVDTTGDEAPDLNDVLKWNGSNFVPGTAGDTSEFTFSIDSFSDGIADTNQLIGSGEWKAIGDISFTATYSNAPDGMTAEVAMSGSDTPWGGNLSMTPVTGAELNTEAVDYPAATGGTITFTLSQDADASEDTETVTFNNTMRYGNSAQTIGNQTEGILEGLTEVSGPSESRSQTISNIATTANYLVFAYADRLSDIQQVRRNHDGYGYVTAAFAADRTSVNPDVQTGVANVENSAGYSETFACITSKDTGLADNTDDFQVLTSGTAQNYVYWGEVDVDAGGDGGNVYSEANVEDNIASEPGRVASNSISSRSMTVNAAIDEYTYIAYPARLGALSSILIGGFESIGDFWIDAGSGTELAITNDAGFTEDYYVYVSKNPGFTDPTTMTVSL